MMAKSNAVSYLPVILLFSIEVKVSPESREDETDSPERGKKYYACTAIKEIAGSHLCRKCTTVNLQAFVCVPQTLLHFSTFDEKQTPGISLSSPLTSFDQTQNLFTPFMFGQHKIFGLFLFLQIRIHLLKLFQNRYM